MKSNITKSFKKKAAALREMPCLADGGSIGAAIRHGSGPVRGPGGPRDDKVPAMLSDGEYVLPADVVKKVGVENLDEMLEEHHTPTEDIDGDGMAAERREHGLRAHFADGGDVQPVRYGSDGSALSNTARDPDSSFQTRPADAPAGAGPMVLADTKSAQSRWDDMNGGETNVSTAPATFAPNATTRTITGSGNSGLRTTDTQGGVTRVLPPNPVQPPPVLTRMPAAPAPVAAPRPVAAPTAPVPPPVMGVRAPQPSAPAPYAAPQDSLSILARGGPRMADGGPVSTVLGRRATIDGAVDTPAPAAPAPVAQPAQPAAPAAPTGNFDPAFLAKNGLGADGRPLPKPSIFDRAKKVVGLRDGGEVRSMEERSAGVPERGSSMENRMLAEKAVRTPATWTNPLSYVNRGDLRDELMTQSKANEQRESAVHGRVKSAVGLRDGGVVHMADGGEINKSMFETVKEGAKNFGARISNAASALRGSGAGAVVDDLPKIDPEFARGATPPPAAPAAAPAAETAEAATARRATGRAASGMAAESVESATARRAAGQAAAALSPEATAFEAARAAKGAGFAAAEAAPAANKAYQAARSVGSGLRAMGSVAGPAFSTLGGAALASIDASHDAVDRGTEDYYRRLGMDTNDRSLPRDVAARTVGVLGDTGASVLDLGTSVVNGVRGFAGATPISTFGEILRQNDGPTPKTVGPYAQSASRPQAAASTSTDRAGGDQQPVGAVAEQPQQPVQEVGLRAPLVDPRSLPVDPMNDRAARRAMYARQDAMEAAAKNPEKGPAPDMSTWDGMFTEARNRRQGNVVADRDERRRASMASEALARSGQALTHDASLRSNDVAREGHYLTARSAANAAKIAQFNADRTHAFEVERHGDAQAKVLSDRRAASVKSATEEIASQLPPGPDGKPDMVAAAEHAQAIQGVYQDQMNKVMAVLKADPSNAAAQANYKYLSENGIDAIPQAVRGDIVNRRRVENAAAADHSFALNPFGSTSVKTAAGPDHMVLNSHWWRPNMLEGRDAQGKDTGLRVRESKVRGGVFEPKDTRADRLIKGEK